MGCTLASPGHQEAPGRPQGGPRKASGGLQKGPGAPRRPLEASGGPRDAPWDLPEASWNFPWCFRSTEKSTKWFQLGVLESPFGWPGWPRRGRVAIFCQTSMKNPHNFRHGVLEPPSECRSKGPAGPGAEQWRSYSKNGLKMASSAPKWTFVVPKRHETTRGSHPW